MLTLGQKREGGNHFPRGRNYYSAKASTIEVLGLEGAFTASLSSSEGLVQVLLGSCLCSPEVLIATFILYVLSLENTAGV